MAVQAKKKLTLEAWGHASVKTVPLRSGAGEAKVRPTDVPSALASGRIPNPLIPVALAGFDISRFDASSEADRAKLAEWNAWQDWLIADSLLEPKATAEFVSQVVDDKPHMPKEDRDQLWGVITHADQMLEQFAKFLADLPSGGPGGSSQAKGADA